jgi:hypothetical protein
VTEQRGADGTCEKRNPEGGKRRQCRCCGIGRWKEQRRKDEYCGSAVDIKIEEFNRGADHAREQHLPRCVNGPLDNHGVLGHPIDVIKSWL